MLKAQQIDTLHKKMLKAEQIDTLHKKMLKPQQIETDNIEKIGECLKSCSSMFVIHYINLYVPVVLCRHEIETRLKSLKMADMSENGLKINKEI